MVGQWLLLSSHSNKVLCPNPSWALGQKHALRLIEVPVGVFPLLNGTCHAATK